MDDDEYDLVNVFLKHLAFLDSVIVALQSNSSAIADARTLFVGVMGKYSDSNARLGE